MATTPGTLWKSRKLYRLLHPNLAPSLCTPLSLHELKSTHALFISSGRADDPFAIGRLLASSCANSGGELLRYAIALFSAFCHPTLFMFNSMIRGFSRSREPSESLRLYVLMLRRRFSPDRFTFPFLIRSCAAAKLHSFGLGIHCHVLKLGFVSDVYVVNNLLGLYAESGRLLPAQQLFDESSEIADVVSWTEMVTGYSNSGQINYARHMFDRMPVRNSVSWNAMIAGYARAGRAVEARELFSLMEEKDTASWSSMISGFAQSGLCDEALEVFEEMIVGNVSPNEPALVSAVSACSQLRDLERAQRIHLYIEGLEMEMSVILGTALVDMHGKCGSIKNALQLFDRMPQKNVFSWNSAITSLALNGGGKQALTLFWKMRHTGLEPNSISFVGVLTACSHAGLVDEGWRLFEMMVGDYGIRPMEEHYGCMVDLLGRAGLTENAMEFAASMADDPHPGLWGALAGACRVHGDTTLGYEVGKQLVGLEPEHAGRYVLLSNLYASAMKWDHIEVVRKLLVERGVRKVPGNSAVETGWQFEPDP